MGTSATGSLTKNIEEAQSALVRAAELAKLAESNVSDEIRVLLEELYSALFIEAVYDATTEATQKFARPLWEKIRRLNELIGFRR